MDKNAIKKYAVWARRELIERVSQRAMFYGVTSQSIGDPNAVEVNGRLLSQVEKKQRQALIRNVQEKGFEQVMEEVAYTWFNRFAALRFMEVNGYLPSLVRVFTNEAGEFKPQILSEALHLDLEGLDKQKVLELESGNKSEALFRYLLIVQCNALNSILPGMFQRIEDYTELLLPDNLLRDGSVIEQLVSCIPEEDWTDQVQIIGWLYQYYNTEPKDKVFADLKKNIKITKENIPAATQLFTPDWIVHYMVENSLGRLWLEGHPNDALKSEWKYYLDEAEQEPEVQVQLATLRKEYGALKPEEIRVIDPCCGSGHILVVMFDVLVQIYEDYGYTTREAASQILENNLWGLDIDERAAQLSYFAVMMKARQYDRRFFTRKVQPHVYAIEESNGITEDDLSILGGDLNDLDRNNALTQMSGLLQELHDAKEYGSIISVTACDWDLLRRFNNPRQNEHVQLMLGVVDDTLLSEQLAVLIDVGEALAQKYDTVVTNPPYMGSSGMSKKLSDYVKKNYPDSKSDLFAVFIERGFTLTKPDGYESMITMESWMFLSSFEKLRLKLMQSKTIKTLVHMPYLGKGGTSLGINFGTDMAVIQNRHIKVYVGTYDRIAYYETDDDGIPFEFPTKNEYYKQTTQDNFAKIPGAPIAYWVSHQVFSIFADYPPLSSIGDARKGLVTLDNERFLRLWHEVSKVSTGFTIKSGPVLTENTLIKWVPIQKGGLFRKWYGNNTFLVNWNRNGQEIKDGITAKYGGGSYTKEVRSEEKYFKPGVTWTVISSGRTGFRRYPEGYIFSNSGESITVPRSDENILNYLTGALNTKFSERVLSLLTPTMGFESGYVGEIPIPSSLPQSDVVIPLVKQNVSVSKMDWDAFETSWDFQRHPLLPVFADDPYDSSTIELWFRMWERQCENRFQTLKQNEEELNRIFIDIYGLQDELNPEVEEKDITVRKADLSRDIRSFISYAVGCMFGRYSLAVKGLSYAGGVWDNSKYGGYLPDVDGIIPICDDEYFEDDIVGRFVKFVETVYGKDTLEENLRFIADALGGKGSSREVIRNYFINDFYADHLKVYQKRPIYWLFDSGKKNGFKCLIYMHRYQPDTIARIRTDYVHEQQSRYRTAISDLEHRVDGASPAERVKLTKQLSKVRDQAEELRVYEEKIHHLADQMISIDLDDGVKVNYAKFQDVLAKIK